MSEKAPKAPRAAEGVGPYNHQCTVPPYFIFHFQFSISQYPRANINDHLWYRFPKGSPGCQKSQYDSSILSFCLLRR